MASGRTYLPDDVDKEMINIPEMMQVPDDGIMMNTDDIYKEFALRGYNYMGPFRQMLSCNREGNVDGCVLNVF